MKVKLSKGSEVFQFFGDYYKFLSDFYVPETNDNYYDKMIHASDDILQKYAKCDFVALVKGILLVTVIYLGEIKAKDAKGGCHWTISWKEQKGEHKGNKMETMAYLIGLVIAIMVVNWGLKK